MLDKPIYKRRGTTLHVEPLLKECRCRTAKKAFKVLSFEGLFRHVVLQKCLMNYFKIATSKSMCQMQSERSLIPQMFTNYGKWLHHSYVPQIFNCLPSEYCNLNSMRIIKKALKTFCIELWE